MAPAQIQDMNDLLATLSQLTVNDTKVIKRAEKMLKAFFKTPSNAAFLVLVLRNHQTDPAVRLQAALYLKKKIGAFYPKYPAQQQQELKMEVLQLLLNEPEPVVANNIASVVAAVAKAVFEKKQPWDELFSMLMTLTSDPDEKRRALNFKLLGQLAEHCADSLRAHTGTIAQMFAAGCQDGNGKVASAALEGINEFIDKLRDVPEIAAFGMVMPHMLSVLARLIQSGDEDIVIRGLDVLQEMSSMEQPLVNDYIEQIVQFCVTAIRAEQAEASVKQAAGQTLMDVIENRPKLFAKKGLVNITLLTLMEMIAADRSPSGSLFAMPSSVHNNEDGDEDDDDEDEDDAEVNLQRLAQTIIDNMAIHIPSKYFVDTALGLCSQGVSSPDPHMRKAGCAVLGVIAEGCADSIRSVLPQILPYLLGATKDPEAIVRECACFAVGQFSEHCQPDILHYNHLVLPAMFDALDDIHTVQCTACYVLEYFCEGLQAETLRPYLRQLLEKLVHLLRSDKAQVKEMALSALAATAVAAEKDFVPFVEPVCAMLEPYLFLTEPSQFNLRGRALECWGHIAVGVGCEHFARFFPAGMQSAITGAKLDTSLAEHCFVFVANGSKCMAEHFHWNGVDYTSELLPFILETLEESEVVQFVDEDEEDDEPAGGAAAAGASGAGGGEEDDEDDGSYRINVEEGFINTKKAALTALGALAEHTKQLFCPYLPRALSALVSEDNMLLTSVHEAIRAETVNILQHFVAAIQLAKNIPLRPTRGVVVDCDPEAQFMFTQILSQVCTVLLTDDAKLPVAQACEGLCGILESLGSKALHLSVGVELAAASPSGSNAEPELRTETNTVLSFVITALRQLFSQSALCQRVNAESSEAHGEEEDDDHDNILMDSVFDLLSHISQALPANVFQPFFNEFFPAIQNFLKPNRPPSDRAMAIGCLAEIFKDLETLTLAYLPATLPVLQANLADPLESVRRNSAFCMHVIIETCAMQLVDHHLTFLQWLAPLCQRPGGAAGQAGGASSATPGSPSPSSSGSTSSSTSSILHHNNLSTVDSQGADVDNSISAVCKMMQINPNLPLASILPVLLNALPLRGDNTEGPNVYRTLTSLLVGQHPVLGERLNVQAFQQVLYLCSVNVQALEAGNHEISLLTALVAVLVQTLSTNSNATDETKAIVRTALREAAAVPVLKQALESYLGALLEADARNHVIAQLQ